MGKMKEEFLNNREQEIIQEVIDAFIDDDYQLEEYYASLKPEDDCCGNNCHCEGESPTQEEVDKNWNDWWDSLSEMDKEKLYNEQKEAEEYFNNNEDKINDVKGPNNQYGV